MKQAEDKPRFFYVDEAGDTAFYAKRSKRIIIGEDGCSRTLIMGYVRAYDPQPIRDALTNLRAEVAKDKYLKDIPSIKKTLFHFHAKDDCPEVRKMVYETISGFYIRAQFIVARKIESLFASKYSGSQANFYYDLITRLFRNQLHLSTRIDITFSRRGTKAKQGRLRAAVERGAEEFRKKFKAQHINNTVNVHTNQPQQEPMLQVIDYLNWAVQRAYERGEMRYFEFVRDSCEMVWDMFDFKKIKNKEKCIYDRAKNPFDIKKASPLS